MKHNKSFFTKARYSASGSRKKSQQAIPQSILNALEKQGKLPEELRQSQDKPKKNKTGKSVQTPSEYAATLYASRPEVLTDKLPHEITFIWHGARLMTNNQMLHSTTYLFLRPFKKACHELCRAAMLETKELRRFSFTAPVKIDLLRVAKRKVDRDGLNQMFKFLIDGLVINGLLIDDSDQYVSKVDGEQEVGDYRIEITLTQQSSIQTVSQDG